MSCLVGNQLLIKENQKEREIKVAQSPQVFGRLELIVALMILWVGRIFSQSQHTRSAVIGEEQNWPNLLLDLIMKHWLLFADDFSPMIKSKVLLWIRNFSAPVSQILSMHNLKRNSRQRKWYVSTPQVYLLVLARQLGGNWFHVLIKVPFPFKRFLPPSYSPWMVRENGAALTCGCHKIFSSTRQYDRRILFTHSPFQLNLFIFQTLSE